MRNTLVRLSGIELKDVGESIKQQYDVAKDLMRSENEGIQLKAVALMSALVQQYFLPKAVTPANSLTINNQTNGKYREPKWAKNITPTE
jgi:hypothetical protein